MRRGTAGGAGERVAPWLAALLALAATGLAIRWGAFVAGGSDSHCYVAQARMWLDGTILRPFEPGLAAAWPNARESLAPIGFVPSQVVPGGLAPICPPGFSVLLAGAEGIMGPRGLFAVVPLCAGITVWCAFVIGRRLGGAVAGLLGAVLVLASPVFLFQALQPMSDVPAAACWLAALALAAQRGRWSAAAAGLAASLAILVRPNLAPLAGPVALLAILAGPVGATWRSRLWPAFACVAGMLPGVAAVALLHALVYGSPFRSGYGDAGQLFALSNVATNLGRYPRWLVETQSPWVLLGLLAPLALPARGEWWPTRIGGAQPRAMALACLLAIGTCAAIYLPYVPFDNWSYLRFLLVAVALLVVTSSAVMVTWLSRLPRLVGWVVGLVLAIGLGWYGLATSRERGVFGIKDSEARFVESATWVREHLPANAVLIAVFHSGALRYHGDRLSVLWDALQPDGLDAFLAELTRQGRSPYLVFESWEVPLFRERFGGASDAGTLDWPPRAQIGREVTVYDPAARARYLRGESVPSERVWTASERRRFK